MSLTPTIRLATSPTVAVMAFRSRSIPHNQVTGFSYDSNGDQNADIFSHALAFDPNGMLSSVAGGQETYVYDAQGNAWKCMARTVTDTVDFGSTPCGC